MRRRCDCDSQKFISRAYLDKYKMKRKVKKMKKALLISIVLVMIFALVACGGETGGTDSSASSSDSSSASSSDMASGDSGSESSGDATTETKNYKFGLTIQTLDNAHWTRLIAGLKSAMRDGDELVVLNAEYDSAKQITQLEDLMAQQCDLIFYVAVDGAAINPGLQQCTDAGIPTVAIDIAADTLDYTTVAVATDNYKAGELMGESLAEYSDGTAKVAIIAFDAVEPARLRIEGAKSILEQYDGIEVVNEQQALPSTEEALPVFENMIQSTPDITDVICVNDLQAFAVANVLEGLGLTGQIRVYATDGNVLAAQAILDGEQTMTAAQYPDIEGSTAMEVAYKILEGGDYEQRIGVKCESIVASNAQEYIDYVNAQIESAEADS